MALTVPGISQNGPAICPMQAARRTPTTEIAKILPPHCHATKDPIQASTRVQCVVSHACCKMAPGGTRFPIRYSRIVLAHSDLMATICLVIPPAAFNGGLHLSIHDLLTRPPVEQLKTDLRI